MSKISYQTAGVDIIQGDAVVHAIKTEVERTFTPPVLSSLGGFAGLYDLTEINTRYQHPVMVQSIDGTGTKAIIARMMNDYSTIGTDLVSATVNDILVIGATPATLLDYIANDRLNPEQVCAIVTSIARACHEHGIALMGGETAEMPDIYRENEHDIVGIVTGFVEKDQIIDGRHIQEGDIVLGLQSSGLHTNGYSLARYICFKHLKLKIDSHVADLSQSIGEALLTPHINYQKPILDLLKKHQSVVGMAHITGGGLPGNLNRVLPKGLNAEIRRKSWPELPLFNYLKQAGDIEQDEMFRSFNMGIGYVLVVKAFDAQAVQHALSAYGCYEIGTIVPGNQDVVLL